jgi:hypothetical protein
MGWSIRVPIVVIIAIEFLIIVNHDALSLVF